MSDSPVAPESIVIGEVAYDLPEAVQLREEQQAELREVYDGDAEPGIKPTAADVAVFLLAVDRTGDGMGTGAGTAVGCGGLRPLDGSTAEIKRMYVRPSHRGRGLSRRLLAELENRALAAGWVDVVLETGDLQSAAISLYESSGYRHIPSFGAYASSPTSRCFGKSLLTRDTDQRCAG